ncbi:protein gone early [Anoplophora glabripennis]|uniref:protein gone early n=2 Tax=Anoplophora glabripennis TaxID=217634 RepID=UPI00087566EC|nr:protein gone early [Anoplophora glabripennis]XP_018570153.1 protein gone early [Anoplophora glabripennis]XP_018570154.1 protein gone early [Anoplophora glabripennis]
MSLDDKIQGTNGTETKNLEASELDPCMEDTKDGRKSDFFHRYRDRACEKSGLSHKGLYIVGGIVILAALLFIVVIALAAAWPRIPHRYQFPVCRDAECLEAAAQIQEGLNSSVSPCDDLWQATCGGWLKKYPLPKDRGIWNQKQQLVRRESERVRDLIATLELPVHSGTVEWKLKHLYEACLDVDNVNTDDARPLLDIISELGGWYVLRDWSETDFDRNKIFTQLHVRYGVSPFFKISVEPNPNMPGHNSIVLSPSGLGLPDKEYYFRDEDDRVQMAYKEYIRDVIIHLSSTARNEATKFGTDMFSYEKRIAEVTPNTIDLQNPVAMYNSVSISELKETTLIPFYDLLQAMYPESNITENTEVIVTSLEYLGHIAQIISTTDRKTMNGYLIWTLVRRYIPYLSNKYTSAMDTFNSELFGIEKPLPRWEICAGIVRKFMGLATNNFLEKDNPIPGEAISVVNNTFNSIATVVRNRLGKFENNALLYRHLKLKLATLRLQVGVPENAKKEPFLKSYFSSLRIIKTNLFESVKNAISFNRKLEEKKLTNLVHEEPMMSYALENVPKVTYSPSDHTVVIPRNLLTDPVFHYNYPSSILYGRLGVEIAEAVISSILPYDSLWTSDRKILSPYHKTVDDSINSVHSALKCLSDYASNLNLVLPYGKANETSLRNLKHLSAVSVTNEALKLSLENTDHLHQPSLEMYEDSALFFLAYSQTKCSESTVQHQLYENIIHFQLPQKVSLLSTWAQVPEFSESLECNRNRKLQCSDIF